MRPIGIRLGRWIGAALLLHFAYVFSAINLVRLEDMMSPLAELALAVTPPGTHRARSCGWRSCGQGVYNDHRSAG